MCLLFCPFTKSMTQMQNTDSRQVIRFPVTEVSATDLIQQLSDENFQLRQALEKASQSNG